MTFFKTILLCLAFTLSTNSFAIENAFEKGWTEELYKTSVDSCIASAVNSNMKHIIEKENIKKESDKYSKILKQVKQHQTAVCKCTQTKIMTDYQFSEINKIMENKNYIINAAKSCNEKVLNNKK